MYVIAEIGSNYHSIEDCILSIELAKKAGADAVKFQHFTLEEMYGKGKGEVTPETWLTGLHRTAKQIEMDFSCTFFEPHKLKKHLHLLDFIKIASSNMMDFRLLDIARASGLKTYISTGGHELHEVQRVYDYFPEASFLYCESAYPSNVNNYKKMRDFFFEGISDHSKDVYPDYPKCSVVEKHVNFVSLKGTADAGHSLDFWEFSRFCNHVKSKTSYYPLLSPEEVDMRLLYNVRFVAKNHIEKGDLLTWANVGVFRGTVPNQKYINPMDVDKIIGHRAKRSMDAWSTIESSDIQTSQRETEPLHT